MQDYNIEDSIYSSDEVISYTLQSEDNNNMIKAGETKIVYLSVRYKNKINKNEYQDGAYNNNEKVSFSFLRNDIISEPSSKNIENPETSSNTIYIEIIICIFSLAIIVYLLTKCKNKYIKSYIDSLAAEKPKDYEIQLIKDLESKIIIQDLNINEQIISILNNFYFELQSNSFEDLSLALYHSLNERISFISIKNGYLIIKGNNQEEKTIYTTLQEDELSEEMHNLLSKSKNRNK